MPLIAIDSVDGSGKTTLVEGVLRGLRSRGIQSESIHFPTNSQIGFLIKSLLRDPILNAQLLGNDKLILPLLFEADRRTKLPSMLYAKNTKNFYLLLDRFYASGLAYAIANGLDYKGATILNSIISLYPKPDHAFIIDTPISETFKRMLNREKDSFESSIALQVGVRNEMLLLARRNNWHILDGLSSPDILAGKVMETIL
jgi:dTMP kinase